MSLHQARYSWAYGYKSRQSAEDAIEDAYANGEVSLCEDPQAESYISVNGIRAWRISLIDTALTKYA
jgi:uncharacterized protein